MIIAPRFDYYPLYGNYVHDGNPITMLRVHIEDVNGVTGSNIWETSIPVKAADAAGNVDAREFADALHAFATALRRFLLERFTPFNAVIADPTQVLARHTEAC